MAMEIIKANNYGERDVNIDVNTVQNIQPKDENEGVFLTWKNLWVTVANGNKHGSRPILEDLTGYAQPGELLAIMGPSGCGKSTLLDALSGRLNSKTRQSGDIHINGRKQELAYGTSAYVTQDDTLITTLTVREAVYYSAQLQLPDSMSKPEKKERAETTITEMGLQEAIDTRIGGGWGAKGLSGGQKRRLTICIETLTRPKLLFLDEPTSGLDSAASYYVMSRIASLDVKDGLKRTIVVSIHQPSTEVFQLFNNLCLLSSGKTVYFGPASATNEFFALNGFPCSTYQNPSDHFLKTINKDFEKDLEQGLEDAMPTEEVINILTKSYESSELYQEVLHTVAQVNKEDYGGLDMKRSHASFLNQCLLLTRRSFVNMYRDVGYYWLRFAIYVVLAFGLASIYFDLGSSYSSIQARGSLLMFISTFLTFMAIGGFPSFVEEMKVFGQERLNGHYGATAFVISNKFSSIPFLLMISLIPGAIAYYLTGLQKGFEHFLCFTSILFGCMILIESMMMVVASIVPNFLMGIIAGAGIQGLMALGGGFFRLPNDLPATFWKYPLYYISFHKYAYQGLFKNEYKGLKFQSNNNNENNHAYNFIDGEDILRDVWHVEMGYSKWVDIVILVAMAIFYRILFLIIFKATEMIKPFARVAIVPARGTTDTTKGEAHQATTEPMH